MVKNNTKYNIESQELIKEVKTKSYETVRLSRVKYFENDYFFIDIRYFRRGFDENGLEIFYPTKKGVQIKEELFAKIFDTYFKKYIEKILNHNS